MNFNAMPSVNKRITNTGMLFALLAMAVLSACNANTGASVSPSAATTKILVVNASPDLGPITLAVGSVQLGGFFRYPTPSNYYSLGTGSQNLQIRNTKYTSVIIRNDVLAVNTAYSLYVMGIIGSTAPADSLSSILVADTASIPAIGYGKVRFVNASPRTPGLDVRQTVQRRSALLHTGVFRLISRYLPGYTILRYTPQARQAVYWLICHVLPCRMAGCIPYLLTGLPAGPIQPPLVPL